MARAQAYVALLRAVNVGGRALPVKELAELVSSLGHGDVRTYIQSGNVVFTSDAARTPLARSLETAIGERFGLDVTVILRTPAELATIAEQNPFRDASGIHVVFFDRAPGPARAAKVDPERSPGDEIRVAGANAYLQLRNGAGRTKLTLGYLERVLAVRGTQRSWNTLLKLQALGQRPAGG